mmetsp:Transcript_42097/g.116351  ORF Transcript_42097/g.116351 Transcript_42097/m.116351 type:complete len:272 (-) Transcript_42097:242-1057(-)
MDRQVTRDGAAHVERKIAHGELRVKRLERVEHAKDSEVRDGRSSKMAHRLLEEKDAFGRLREELFELLPPQVVERHLQQADHQLLLPAHRDQVQDALALELAVVIDREQQLRRLLAEPIDESVRLGRARDEQSVDERRAGRVGNVLDDFGVLLRHGEDEHAELLDVALHDDAHALAHLQIGRLLVDDRRHLLGAPVDLGEVVQLTRARLQAAKLVPPEDELLLRAELGAHLDLLAFRVLLPHRDARGDLLLEVVTQEGDVDLQHRRGGRRA